MSIRSLAQVTIIHTYIANGVTGVIFSLKGVAGKLSTLIAKRSFTSTLEIKAMLKELRVKTLSEEAVSALKTAGRGVIYARTYGLDTINALLVSQMITGYFMGGEPGSQFVITWKGREELKRLEI